MALDGFVALGEDDVTWPLGRQSEHPVVHCGAGSYAREYKVDPHPAYAPNPDLVQAELAACIERFPLRGFPSKLYTIPREFTDRINGISYTDGLWRREDGSEWQEEITCQGCGEKNKVAGLAFTIVLSAKRIPIHPAMIRYLVAHEYGHNVFSYIARKRGYHDQCHGKLEEQYMEIRGVKEYAKVYTGGKWHQSPGEIIANDFRTLIMGKELEFWVHDVPLAKESDPIAAWWRWSFDACGLEAKFA